MPTPFIVRIAYDEPPFAFTPLAFDDFKEADHPRDASGKFTEGTGQSGGSEAEYVVTNHIKAILKEAGYKAAFKGAGKVGKEQTFKHPSGAQVMIHPPAPGKKFSSLWTSYKDGSSTKTGEGTGGISALLKTAVGKAEAKSPEFKEMQKSLYDMGVINELKNKGFTPEGEPSNITGTQKLISPNGENIFYSMKTGNWTSSGGLSGSGTGKGWEELVAQHPEKTPEEHEELPETVEPEVTKEDLDKAAKSIGAKLDAGNSNEVYHTYTLPNGDSFSYHEESDEWGASINGGDDEGEGLAGLIEFLQDNAGDPEAGTVPASVAPPKKTEVATHVPPKELYEKKGYKYSQMKYNDKGEGQVAVYQDGDKKVEWNLHSSEWLAKTPGYPTKIGTGEEDLMKLLNGDKVYKKDDGAFSWNNTSAETLPMSGVNPYQPPVSGNAPKKSDPPQNATEKPSTEKAYIENHKAQQTELLKLRAIAPTPTPSQNKALKSYTGSGYNGMNSTLRSKILESAAPAMKDKIKHLDTFLGKTKVPEDTVLFRKISGKFADLIQKTAEMSKGFPPGVSRVMDEGYGSSSTHSNVWSGTTKIVMKVRKGQLATAVSHMSATGEHEKEVMLPRKTAYVIEKIDSDGWIHCTIDQSHHGISEL